MSVPSRKPIGAALAAILATGCASPEDASDPAALVRLPLPEGSTFPIAAAVEVPAGATVLFHSGLTPRPADPAADAGSRAYYGDTETQTAIVLQRLEASLEGMGYELGDVVKMTVFLVADPATGGGMDFAGFMAAYTRYFGTAQQPSLPARSAVQVAGLVRPGMLVEIDVVVATVP
jgi:enamine deaminase RidA (YjgF/YER057c/UK114 family)